VAPLEPQIGAILMLQIAMAKQSFSFQHDFLSVGTRYVLIHALSIFCPVNAVSIAAGY